MVSICHLKKQDLKLLKDYSIELGTHISFLEKDYYGVQLLYCLNNMNLPGVDFLFSGGTALARAYHIPLNRYSEDYDIVIPITDNSSTKSRRSIIRKEIESSLNQFGFEKIERGRSHADGKNNIFQIFYLNNSNRPDSLKPTIKLEIVFKNSPIGNCQKKVSSFLNEINNMPAELENMKCVNIEEIYAGKLSALIWRFGMQEDDDYTLYRHFYDLSVINEKMLSFPIFFKLAHESLTIDLKDRVKEKVKNESIYTAFEKIEKRLTQDHSTNCKKYISDFVYKSAFNYEDSMASLKNVLYKFKQYVNSITSN